MKALLIGIGIVAAIGVAVLAIFLFRVVTAFRTATGQALYSSVGSWTRIQEFAHAQGKSNYIVFADTNLAMLEHNLKIWRENAPSSVDFTAFEKMRATAYETADRNIKNGQNPLAYLDSQQQTGGSNQTNVGMSEFAYLACDGGPHLVLPKELSRRWKGARSVLSVISRSGDYGRACAAIANQRMALIPVGSGQAMVLADPPMSAWGRSPEGWVDIYFLDAWPDTNTDAMIKRAVAAMPSSAMSDTGKSLALKEPGLILLFAGDAPGNTAYGEHDIPIEPGRYQILEGHYKVGDKEELYVYRLQPKTTLTK